VCKISIGILDPVSPRYAVRAGVRRVSVVKASISFSPAEDGEGCAWEFKEMVAADVEIWSND
jgi:hypothetical protein